MDKKLEADVIVIGAGISGTTLAERCASKGKKVLVVEKRDHIGGNCYNYYNKAYLYTNTEHIYFIQILMMFRTTLKNFLIGNHTNIE